ncbi:hypothetical protein BH09PAT2_BH09PAT2_10210 [soil metagenome]
MRNYEYDEEKDEILKNIRGLGFEDIIDAIDTGYLLADIKNPKTIYPHQFILAVQVGKYVYAVPYVYDERSNSVFLKTIYPSRKLTKSYLSIQK